VILSLLLMMRPCGHSAHACCASVCNCCPGRHGQQPLPAGLRPCQACNRCCCPACQQWVTAPRCLCAAAPQPPQLAHISRHPQRAASAAAAWAVLLPGGAGGSAIRVSRLRQPTGGIGGADPHPERQRGQREWDRQRQQESLPARLSQIRQHRGVNRNHCDEQDVVSGERWQCSDAFLQDGDARTRRRSCAWEAHSVCRT